MRFKQETVNVVLRDILMESLRSQTPIYIEWVKELAQTEPELTDKIVSLAEALIEENNSAQLDANFLIARTVTITAMVMHKMHTAVQEIEELESL